MKIIILGVGNAQFDAVQHCKERGWTVHGLSYREEGPALNLVDHFGLVNIVDAEAVTNYAVRVGADIIYSVGSDVAMPVVGTVSKKLGLPYFVDADMATLLQRKGELRRFLTKNGISPLKFHVGKSISDFVQWKSYPSIIKPVDSQGQRGVYELSHEEDLSRYFPMALQHSRSGEVIVEEYINGPEISVNAFVRDSTVEDAFVSDRFVLEGFPGGLVKGHGIPSTHHLDVQNKARNLAECCIAALGIKNGPVYFQMKVQNGIPHVIEITPRLDGCHMWRLIKFKYGVDLLDKTFSLLTGNPISADGQKEEGFLQLSFDLQKPGSIFQHDDKANFNAIFEQDYYRKGEIIRPINGHMEKTGYHIRNVS